MTRIILVRHGQSIANEKNLFAGHSDFDLSELGKKQARAVANYLKNNERIDVIRASDLLRAYHTATPVGEALGLPIVKDLNFREIFGGAWESMPFEEIAKRYPDAFSVWRTDYAHSRPVDGESTKEVYERVVPYICQLAKKNDGNCLLIATHATVVRAFDAYAHGLGSDEVGQIPFVHNASINIYTYDEGTVTAVRTNVTEHLHNMVTKLPDIINA
ncbi:MAG: histidine phosphatase family protein [Clostridia bacterium]|nr:histidine phosphatase family protein [Clostridia bacterium]